jgi:hypothetical protein
LPLCGVRAVILYEKHPSRKIACFFSNRNLDAGCRQYTKALAVTGEATGERVSIVLARHRIRQQYCQAKGGRVIADLDKVGSNCHVCGFHARAESKPGSVLARLWRWHTGWCAGWKNYLKELESKGLCEMAEGAPSES